jgi:hypothetical protein
MMIMQETEQPLSPESATHLRKVLAEISAFMEGGGAVPEPSSVDAAWMVLEAANDFGDGTTIEACRRVIDASLNGTLAAQSDLVVVNDYFK